MRHALIIAGGSGTRLWPMSRAARPKQLIPLIAGKSLLRLASDRLDGLIPPANRYVCAGQQHGDLVAAELPGLTRDRFIGEPTGRDTLNAIGLGTAIIAQHDPAAVVAVFTADHLIEPVAEFRRIINLGYEVAEQDPAALVTFGITPTEPATGYGYLQLGAPLGAAARIVEQFKEKPDAPTARAYLDAGPQRYLWNSGMFIWQAATLLECIRQFEPANHAGIARIAQAWPTPRRDAVLAEVFPTLKKISVDFAVMEPASRDPRWRVAAVPMPLQWIDVGAWSMFARTCPQDENGNSLGTPRTLLLDTHGTLAASSDPRHLIAAIGCDDLIIVHTPEATLVCRKDCAQLIKDLHQQVGARFGDELL